MQATNDYEISSLTAPKSFEIRRFRLVQRLLNITDHDLCRGPGVACSPDQALDVCPRQHPVTLHPDCGVGFGGKGVDADVYYVNLGRKQTFQTRLIEKHSICGQ